MTSEAHLKTLGKIVTLQTEKVIENKDRHMPYIGLEHIASDGFRLIGAAMSEASISVNSVFQKDDILFGKLRPNLRKSVRAPFSGYCSTDILVLRSISGIDPGFVSRIFQWDRVFDAAVATAAGTKMPRTSWSDLKEFQVLIPESIKEQERIACVLDNVDDEISRTDALIDKLKQIRTGLLHDLLTCGLDENGKLRDPITNPQQFSKTSLGLLPKEWKISRLGLHATHLTSGSRGWASHYSREGSIFLRIGNLTREHINLRLDDLIRVRPPPGSEGERTRTQPQDILISITADLGIIGVIPDEFPEAFVNQHIALVRPASDMVARWTSRFLAFGPAARHFRLLNDSGAKAGMSLPSVESLLIAIPSLEEQREASRLLDELDDSITREERITEKLISMKRGLVDDILTGRVRIPPDLLDANL